jgi:hypothetical protein
MSEVSCSGVLARGGPTYKVLVVLPDLHSGHKFGLTAPRDFSGSGPQRIDEKARLWQEQAWAWFKEEIQSVGPIDHCVVNGDAVDGRGERSGSVELITADRNGQVAIAEHVLEEVGAKKYTFVRGTPYHTGDEEDWEDNLAKAFDTVAEDHAWLEESGVVFDFKHHIGSSTVPKAIPPALPREAVWNLLWAEKELQPKSHVIVRSHLHSFVYCGDESYLAMVTPALQGWTRYGARRMSKTISYGFVEFRVYETGEYTWRPHILVPVFSAASAKPL